MKRREYKVVTDHVEMRLVYFEPTSEDFEQRSSIRPGMCAAHGAETESFLMIGPPGGQLARVDANDAALLMVMLERLGATGMRFAPLRRVVPLADV